MALNNEAPISYQLGKNPNIVWRIPSRVSGIEDKQPDVVRHLHDLAKLSERVLENPDFSDLAREAIREMLTDQKR